MTSHQSIEALEASINHLSINSQSKIPSQPTNSYSPEEERPDYGDIDEGTRHPNLKPNNMPSRIELANPSVSDKHIKFTGKIFDREFTIDSKLARYNLTVDDFIKQNPDTHAVIGGICIFAKDASKTDHLLLVQRAESDSYPGFWEVPGGTIDRNGETIMEGCARELFEESGLTAKHFSRDMDAVTFLTGPRHAKKRWLKFSFEAEVSDGDIEGEGSEKDKVGARVQLDPKEHQKWVWASAEEVEKQQAGEVKLKFVTMQQKLIMLDAFAQRQEDREQKQAAEVERSK